MNWQTIAVITVSWLIFVVGLVVIKNAINGVEDAIREDAHEVDLSGYEIFGESS